MTGLAERIAEKSAAEVDPAIRSFAELLAHECDASSVLFYGSNLRTGSLEGVLDFYVLLPGPQREKIWPRVSYREWEHAGQVLRAKIATMSLSTFAAAARGELRDTTIWARFVQPSALIWQRDDSARDATLAALGDAAKTAARLAVALGPAKGTPEDYWRALFQATYQAEFRVEKPGREDSILSVNAAHFDGLLPLALEAQDIAVDRDGDMLEPQMSAHARKDILQWWRRRRRLGKPLNVLRLLKASTTFDGAARYAAWKIERHTGVPVNVTPWREKHPVLAAPAVLFDVWRKQRRS
jgi:hypothetical protein